MRCVTAWYHYLLMLMTHIGRICIDIHVHVELIRVLSPSPQLLP